MFPLFAISEPGCRRGPGLVEAEVGVLDFCHSMPPCAKSECCDDLGGLPLHRRAWNSGTIKELLAATGEVEILAETGRAGASRPCFPPGGSAGWAGHECAKLGSHEVPERSRCDPKAVTVSGLLVVASNATPARDGSHRRLLAAGDSDQNRR